MGGLFGIVTNIFDATVEVVKLPVEVAKEFIASNDGDKPGDKTIEQIKKIIGIDNEK